MKALREGNWAAPYRWAAVGTLIAYSAFSHKGRAQALPATYPPGNPSRQTQGTQPVIRFEIAPGTLDRVVSDFERATGLSVAIARDGVRGVASPGVTGIYTPEQALERLLRDTGLTFRFLSANSVAVDIASVSQAVEVSATVDALAVSSPKYAQPSLDTPQTISAISQEVLAQQGVTTLRDALRNVAGISLAAGEGGAQGDNLTIRGFAARNDLYIDGMRDYGSYYRDPFNTQEVEVLQGPSSVTFGRGSTGGVVNQAAKRPEAGRFFAGDLEFGTDQTRRVALDVNRPLPKLASGAAFRLNLMGHESGVAGRDVARNRRFGAAPSLALGLDSRTRWTFSYFHQNADDTPDYGIPWLFNGPAPVPHENYYGFRDGNYLRTYDDIGTVRTEHTFTPRVAARNQVRFASYVRDALITEAQIATGVTPATPLGAISVNRKQIGVDSTESLLDEQLDVSARFETAGIRHDVVAGIEAARETSNPERPNWTNVPGTSLLDPDPDQPFSGTATVSTRVRATAVTASAYVLDSVQLGRKWIVSGGVRWDRMDADYRQSVAPATAFSRVDRMASWRAAAVYKPVSMGSIYFDAGTSFNPSAESLALAANSASLPPEKNRTYEFGTKWDFAGGRTSVRAAAFETSKLNAREPDPLNPVLNVLAGSQRVRGVQVDVHARLTSRWDIFSSYAHLDARVVRSSYYPAAVGARLANVPADTFSFWGTGRLPGRVEMGAGANFAGSRTASSTAPLDPVTGLVKQLPGYWVFNAMARRRLTEHVDVQVNANNIANRCYYDQLHPAHIVLGPGRSALAGLHFRF